MEILELLKTEPKKALERLQVDHTLQTRIKKLRKEFNDIYRGNRETQLDYIQKDKLIGEPGNKTKVLGVKVPIPMQNKIVRTATAFEIGEPVTIIPFINSLQDEEGKVSKKENRLTREIYRLWKVNRIDTLIQRAIELKKSELQCAVLFYMKDIDGATSFNKMQGVNNKKEIKVDLLQNKDGIMTPIKDETGDMKAFAWQFATTDGTAKTNHTWIYTDELVYKFKQETAGNQTESFTSEKHGFNKIPIVYFSQDNPEWHEAELMIDRIEVAMSKLAAANDYSGHPMLMLYGQVDSLPEKNVDGKALKFEIHKDPNTGKTSHGDAKFLTHDNAPEAVKLELERLEKYIYSLTSTPDLSLENLKGIGDISGKAIRLMFMDAIIKSKMNEGENRTSIERLINVFISGIVTTTGTALKSDANNTFFDIKFNSILPSEINEDIITYVAAVNAKIMSKQEAIKNIGLAEDVQKEWQQIQEEAKVDLDENKKDPIKPENVDPMKVPVIQN